MKIGAKRQQAARQLLELGCETYEAGNAKKAALIFEESAALGSVEAKINLGNLYSEGKGVDRDVPLAKKLYRAAYNAGNAYGATALGAQYRSEGKHKLAVLWFRKAAAMGEEWAAEYLASGSETSSNEG